MKKYELTNETRELVGGRKFYRIRALRDFETMNGRQVQKGDLGGFVEHEHNLSQYDTSWLFDYAVVGGNARVNDHARVGNHAVVDDHAIVDYHARVDGYARVDDYAVVSNHAIVGGNARVGGYAKVGGCAVVGGNTTVVGGNAHIGTNAHVTRAEDFLVVGPIGRRNGYTTFYKTADNGIGVTCGCFRGTIKEFAKKVSETHGNNNHAQMYKAAMEMAKLQILEEE